MKKILSIVLALMLLLASATAFAVEPAGFNPNADLVGTYSQYPLVADGESVTLKVMVPLNDSYAVSWEDQWFWKWWSEATGVTFEVEQVLSSARDQRKSLMFASGELPDLMLGITLSTQEMMQYGAAEKMLLSFKPYMTEEVMPNLKLLLDTYPVSLANITAADGEIYTMPFYVNQQNLNGESARVFIDQARLDAVGKALPETLDAFIETMYAFKEADPDCIPVGGSHTASNPSHYILNAMGFLGKGGNWGLDVTVRNGEAVIPAGDPLYKEFLTIMNKFYTDGIIAEDFFTADNTAVNAKMSEGKLGLIANVPFTITPNYEDWSHWTSVTPMTSQYSDTKQWLAYNTFSGGNVAVSADTEHAELICRLMDFFYSDIGYVYAWEGPFYGSSDTLGVVKGRYVEYDEENVNPYGMASSKWIIPEVEDGTYANNYDYKYNHTPAVFGFGNNGIAVGLSRELGFDVSIGTAVHFKGVGFKTEEQYNYWCDHWKIPYENPAYYDVMTTEGQFRNSMMENISPYEVTGFPAIVYYAEDAALEMADLTTTIEPYVTGEVAKFITGTRSLDEFDSYLSTLEGLGFYDLEQHYKDAYAAYLANIG